MSEKRNVLILLLLIVICCAALTFSACQLFCQHRHSDSYKLIKQPTCAKDGEAVYTCPICGKEVTEVIPASDSYHKYDKGQIIKEPTCTTSGTIEYTCTVCQKSRTETLPATGHTPDSGLVKKEPTCTEPGRKEIHCTTCNVFLEEQEIPALGHNVVPIGEEKEPTCKEKGITSGAKCARCDAVLQSQQVLEIVDHRYIQGVCTWCKVEKVYTAKFEAFGELVLETTFTASTMKNVTAPAIPQKPGYKNVSWEKYTVGYENLSVVALYDLEDYSITYNNADGCDNDNPTTFTVETDTITLTDLEKTGYVFTGWFADSQKVEQIPRGSYGNLKLVAGWEIVNYQITYENYKNVDISALPTTYTIETETITLGAIEATGYTFNGWKIGNETVSTIEKGTCGNLVVVADFTANRYQIMLDANGGAAISAPALVEYGSTYTLIVPVRTGFEFKGWFDSALDSATRYTDANGAGLNTYSLLGNKSLFAHWEVKQCTITFDSNGGTPIANQTYAYGKTFVLPTEPTREGYRFSGWYLSDETTLFTSTTVVYDSATLYARWISSTAVSSTEQLIAIASAPDGNYHLTNDIDLRGNVWTPIENFSGILDGNGHSVKNFSISTTTPSANYGFVCVNNGTIKNVNFVDFTFNVTGANIELFNVGVVAGKNNGSIRNVNLRGGQTAFHYSFIENSRYERKYNVNVGGIVGANESNGRISECNNDAPVVADIFVKTTDTVYNNKHYVNLHLGGVIGINNGIVEICGYEAIITLHSKADADSYEYGVNYVNVGGVAGATSSGSLLQQCYAQGEIVLTAESTSKYGYAYNYGRVGMVAGNNGGVVADSFAGGKITGGANTENIVGGCIGKNDANAEVRSSYCSTVIETERGGHVGGFCGYNAAVIQNSYATGNVSSSSSATIGGLVGTNVTSGTVTKCYSTGGVSAVDGNLGYSIGNNQGIVLNSYYMQGVSVVRGGVYLDNAGDANLVSSINFTELWNEDFLIDTLYWDSQGWTILTDENPLLDWEIIVNHNFEQQVYEPDCVHGGFTVYSCTDCDKLFVKDFVAATGHDYITELTVEPTCVAEGYTTKKCSVCGDVIKTDIVAATGHPKEFATLKTDHGATCTEDGYFVYHCEVCDNDYVVNEDAKGHDGTLVRTVTEPTCTQKGEAVYFCTVCQQEYNVMIDCVEHSWEDVAYKAATCGIERDESGNIVGRNPAAGNTAGSKCSVCGKIDYGCEIINPHNFEQQSVTQAPTCSSTGLGLFKCTLCEFEEEQPIAALGHTDENSDYICDVCGNVLFADGDLSSFTHITDVNGLLAISNNFNANYWLDADLDLAGMTWTPLGTETRPFKGIFYGNNHTISGLSYSTEDTDTRLVGGIFGYNNGLILCLNVSNFSVRTHNASVAFGGIAAFNKGRIVNCNVTGENSVSFSVELTVKDYKTHVIDVDECFVGGLVAVNRSTGLIENCSVSGTINTVYKNRCSVESQKITQFIWSLIYSTSARTVQHVTFGGLVGRNEGAVSDCDVTATINSGMELYVSLSWMKGKAFAYTHLYSGALTGYNVGSISSCTTTKIVYDTESQRLEDSATSLTGRLYEIGYGYYNYSKIGGIDGVIGSYERGSSMIDIVVN